jgi:regulator of RNase E activity RraA
MAEDEEVPVMRAPDPGPPAPLHHVSVVPPRVGPTPDPLPPQAVETLRIAPIEDLSDAVGPLYTMDPGLRPGYAGMPRIVGAALTVKAPPGDNLAVYGGIGLAWIGHVLVVDWRGTTHVCGGGALALAAAHRRGLAGVVVDGAWRDVDELAAQGIPILLRERCAASGAKIALGELNVPVACGGVIVHPGDAVVGDAAGIVVIPRRHLDLVLSSISARLTAQTAAADPEANIARLIDAHWAMHPKGTDAAERSAS